VVGSSPGLNAIRSLFASAVSASGSPGTESSAFQTAAAHFARLPPAQNRVLNLRLTRSPVIVRRSFSRYQKPPSVKPLDGPAQRPTYYSRPFIGSAAFTRRG
jgi:hypothetical protein